MNTTTHDNIEVPRSCTLTPHEATISGDNYKIEFDLEDGTINTRHRGAVVSFHTDISVFDFALRYYSDLPGAFQKFAREVIQAHKDTFTEFVRLHRFRGDSERFKFNAEDARYWEDEWLADQPEEVVEAFDESDEAGGEFYDEIIFSDAYSSKEVLNDALAEFEQEMLGVFESRGFEDMVEECDMFELRRVFDRKKSRAVAAAIEEIEPSDLGLEV